MPAAFRPVDTTSKAAMMDYVRAPPILNRNQNLGPITYKTIGFGFFQVFQLVALLALLKSKAGLN